MKDRATQAERKQRKRKKRPDVVILVNVPKLVRFIALLVMIVLAILTALHLVKQVMPLKSYAVEGISVYESVDIFNASGLKMGDLLYKIDEDAVEERILDACPYLASVELRPIFPTKLQFSVVGRSARWYIDVSGTKYALDGDMFVMDDVGDVKGLTKLILPNVKTVLVGEVPRFGESESELKKTLEILAQIRESSFQTRLSEVNLESRWAISVEVDGSYRILMGDASDFSAKLRAVEEILTSHLPEGCVGGEIDVSMPQNPAFKPIYSSDGESNTP